MTALGGIVLDQATAPRRRLSDLLLETNFLLVQLITLHSSAGPHRTSGEQARMSRLHKRLDALERQLRHRADELGEHELATLGQLRRRLSSIAESQEEHAAHRRRATDLRRGN